jgi:hypothetical protein
MLVLLQQMHQCCVIIIPQKTEDGLNELVSFIEDDCPWLSLYILLHKSTFPPDDNCLVIDMISQRLQLGVINLVFPHYAVNVIIHLDIIHHGRPPAISLPLTLVAPLELHHRGEILSVPARVTLSLSE